MEEAKKTSPTTASGSQGPGGPSRLVERVVSRPGAPHGEALAQGAAPPPQAKKASDLGQRLGTAVILLPLIIYLMIKGGVPWMIFVVCVIGLGSIEFAYLMEAKGLVPARRLGIPAAMALGVLAQGSNEYFVTLLLTATILLLLVRQLGRKDISSAITATSVTIFGVIYVGWLGAHLILLRNLGSEIAEKYLRVKGLPVAAGFEDIGCFFLFLAVAATFLADTGGYFAGRAFGKHKLAPTISPKKTWEGLAGSLVFSALGALVVKAVFERHYAGRPYAADLPYLHCVILGALAALFGVAGDLAESLLKRDARVKDASGFLPGHGGFLDRLDSLNFVVPISYYYIKIYYYLQLTAEPSRDVWKLLQRYGIG